MYKLLLILKYLRKRRIAWVSLLAVTLCTALVIIVISVMGGWLRMARESFHGVSGDVMVVPYNGSFAGFADYEPMIAAIQKLPEVEAAVPVLRTGGFVKIRELDPDLVQVLGYPIDQISRVNHFPRSLYQQHQRFVDAAEDDKSALSDADRDRLTKLAEQGARSPSFELREAVATTLDKLPEGAGVPAEPASGARFNQPKHRLYFKGVMGDADRDGMLKLAGADEPKETEQIKLHRGYLKAVRRLYVRTREPLPGPRPFRPAEDAWVELEDLPEGVSLPSDYAPGIRYDGARKSLVYQGIMSETERDRLLAGRADEAFRLAVLWLYDKSFQENANYRGALPKAKGVTGWPGMILSVGVARLGKGTAASERPPVMYVLPTKLTVVGVAPKTALDPSAKSERNYWIVDDSRTGIWQTDLRTVYVPFDVLQKDLGMDAQPGTDENGNPVTVPARTSEIHIKVKDGVDLYAARDRVEKAVNHVRWLAHTESLRRAGTPESGFPAEDDNWDPFSPEVQTWEQNQGKWLGAIEKEKVLVTFLFGIVSLVSVFLVFCIFYMIVVEKTRDIGIIKSVGATSSGVAGIFLGYGLAIGLVGAGIGLMAAYLIVHNINVLHKWMGEALHVQVWDPEVYQFDTIPNTMEPREVSVIVLVAVLSAVLGALIPAIRAARLHPVEALRWE